MLEFQRNYREPSSQPESVRRRSLEGLMGGHSQFTGPSQELYQLAPAVTQAPTWCEWVVSLEHYHNYF